MRTYRLTMMMATLVLLLASTRASAFANSPTTAIKRTNKTINSLLKKDAKDGSAAAKQIKAKLKQAVNGFLDFEELARRALGKHWDKRSAEERSEFVNILSELIERNYVKQLRSNLSYKLEYRGEQVKGDIARVSTVVKVVKDGRPEEVEIEYKMKRKGSGWMVYDVITDEVSVVRNYRTQFNRIITRDSYEVLVKKMKRKLEKI